MQNFRSVFFQIMLVILALAFVLCIHCTLSMQATEAGSFGEKDDGNITLSQMLDFEGCGR